MVFEKVLVQNKVFYLCLKNGKDQLTKKKNFGALLTNLSKGFDCLAHELLNAYGFMLSALKLTYNYLSNRKQKTKTHLSYTEWLEIIFGFLEGSVFGPLLFNILLADDHISELRENASRKIHVLARVTPYMSISKTCIFMNAFFISQFSYCLLLWMCSSCINNRKVNSLRKPCLQIIYQDKKLSLEQLLINDKSVSVHQRNLQSLYTEM